MTVIFQTGYTLPSGDQPLTHARIAHDRNWLSGGTASASSTDADYFTAAPLNTLTYEKWKPTSLPATWEYDNGAAGECDYCCIAAHTMGTNGNTLQIQYWNGSSWTGVIPSTAITTDAPIMAIFAPQTRARWRISISGGTAPKVGVVKFGKALQMQQAIYQGHTPIDFGRQTILRSNNSETGENLGRAKQRVQLSTSFDWQDLTEGWVRENWVDMQLAVEDEAFWIAWRPQGYGEVGFCQTDQVPVPFNSGPADKMSVSLQVRGLGFN